MNLLPGWVMTPRLLISLLRFSAAKDVKSMITAASFSLDLLLFVTSTLNKPAVATSGRKTNLIVVMLCGGMDGLAKAIHWR